MKRYENDLFEFRVLLRIEGIMIMIHSGQKKKGVKAI